MIKQVNLTQVLLKELARPGTGKNEIDTGCGLRVSCYEFNDILFSQPVTDFTHSMNEGILYNHIQLQ
ncbi:MAG: hypothetical protein KAR43_11330 [Deltaproteobacteria bacterium]|nr:hypothetical protein [Deltaproteobacteria bacterium]